MKPEYLKSESIGKQKNAVADYFQTDKDLQRIQGKYSPVSVLIITILGIAIAEVFAMVVVFYNRDLPYYKQVILDATVMTVIIFPILYFLSFRPILLHIKQRYQVEQVIQTRLRIIQYANTHTFSEILQFTLDELETLMESSAGYFHFIEADQKTIELQAWSTNTLENMCRISGDERHYSLDQAGVWADAIRQRKTIIHNDYSSLPNRKGLPEGHTPILREMAVPILRDDKIVAVIGVGNKHTEYTSRDIEVISTLADFVWDIVKQKQLSDAQRKSEEKFRTLVDWTYDWELWLDPAGAIVYNSPSCQRITGFSSQEFSDDPSLLFQVIHPEDRLYYETHHKLVHDESAGVEKVEYRILERNGEEHWVEHVCRPVFSSDNTYLGRRISNRDITLRKQAEYELEERNQNEKLLTQNLHTVQLDIARDLHDTLGQNIGYIRMKLEYLNEKKTVKKSDLRAELQVMSKAANESYELIRGTLAVLQTNNSSDLFRVFSRYAEQIEERSNVQVKFESEGEPQPLTPKRMRQLFYIFRETIANIEKHAEASHAVIHISWDENDLVLSISDDGKGFDITSVEQNGRYGLRFMKERAELLNGSLKIESTMGLGTRLEVRVPYE